MHPGPSRARSWSRATACLVLVLGGVLAGWQPADGPSDPLRWADPFGPRDPLSEHLNATPIDIELEEELLEALRDAVDEVRDDGSRPAALRADSVLARIPTLADWRPLLRAELLGLAGDTAGVRQALDEVDPRTGFADQWGWTIEVDALLEVADSTRALARLDARADTDAGAGLRLGALHLALGDTVAASAALWSLLESDPSGAAARSAARTLDRIDHRDPADRPDAERLRLGRLLLDAGQWDRAAELLDPAPDDPELRFGLARRAIERNRPSEAIELLEPLVHSDDTRTAALYWTARAALQARDHAGAENAVLRLVETAPDDRMTEDALLLLLDSASGSARDQLFATLLATGVRSGSAELLAVRRGADQYLAGNFESASTTFARYLEGSRSRSARQQASYWHALSLERLGDDEGARIHLERSRDEDPLSFYGLFAGERLGTAVLPADLDRGPAPVPGIERELRNAITRLKVHQIVPTPGSFNHELDRLQRHFLSRGDGAYDFAERLIVRDLTIQGVVLGRELHAREGEWNLRLLRIVYPFPHQDAIVRESRERGLDPFFVAGLIRQESLFHRSIESSAGAVGLMQLLPSTAQEVARSLGLRYSRDQLDDPLYNVRLGTQFLATMLRRFDGRAEDALAAYNAGPGRINQWRQRPEYADRDVFIEHIPFQETRNYVKVVQQNTRLYTALYGCPGFEPCLGDSYLVARARSPFVGGGVPGSSLAR